MASMVMAIGTKPLKNLVDGIQLGQVLGLNALANVLFFRKAKAEERMRKFLITTALMLSASPAIAHHSQSSLDHALDTDIPSRGQLVCTGKNHINVRRPFNLQPVHEGRVVTVLPPKACIYQWWKPEANYQYKLNFAQKSGNWIPLYRLDDFMGYVNANYTHVIDYQ